MPQSYLNLYYHLVFAVKNRDSVIRPDFQNRIYSYIRRIFESQGHHVIQIGGMDDHLHILFCANNTISLSDIVREVKACSSKWINEQRFFKCRFAWQSGYGIFTVSYWGLDKVKNYIRNQEIHHLNKPFLIEFREMLRMCGRTINDDEFGVIE